MTNTLKATSIRAAKAWSGDSDDAWGTRPDGDTWSVTCLLQRRLGDGEWEWVVPAGADPIDEGDSLYGSDVITRTISGSGNHADIELTYLPACDASGTAYSYRLVERVPGSYDVQDADAVDTVATETVGDITYRYVAVEDDGNGQTFMNALRTTSLTGTKIWDDHWTGAAPDFESGKRPELVLYRQVADGKPEQVKMKDGSAPARPDWTEEASGAWKYTYSGLPAADQNDKPYTYSVKEDIESVKGFYSSCSKDDSGNTVITNTATILELTKIGPDGKKLEGCTFEISPLDGSTFADNSTSAVKLATNSEGTVRSVAWLVVGGTYGIKETSAPEGYELVQETLSIKVNQDGSIAVVGEVPSGYVQDGTDSFKVQVTDEPIEIGIEKIGKDSGIGLNGAEFKITGIFAGSSVSEERTFTTDSIGSLVGQINLSSVLKSGQEYTITETTAPGGYKLAGGELKVKVCDNGRLTVVGDAPANYSIDNSGAHIVVVDEPIEVDFNLSG